MVDRHSFFVSDPDFETVIRSYQPPHVPSTLYHYTDASGLMGIVESKSLWLTHFRYTNDLTEVTHGIGIAITKLENTLSESNLPDTSAAVSQYLMRVTVYYSGTSTLAVIDSSNDAHASNATVS